MILLKNGTIYLKPGKVLDKGDLLIDKGKIIKIGKNIKSTKKCEIIDLKKAIVTPGLIDAHCHVGMWEESIGREGSDGNEATSPATPHLRAIDAINPMDEGFKDALKGGVTTIFTGPGSANVIGGLSTVIKTGGSNIVDELVLKDPAGLKMALGENPKAVYGYRNMYPMTRMANAAIMREEFTKAKIYIEKKKRHKKKDGPFAVDMKMEALAMVLEKKIPARVHAHRADDIITAIRIKKEFGFNLVIEHCTEGHLIPEFLAKEKIPAIVGPSLSARVKVELKEISFKTPAILHEHGVLISIMTDAPVIPIDYLRLMVGLSIKEGLPYDAALAAVTTNPAKILGIDKYIGTIEKGKHADIAIFDGDPFDINSNVLYTIVNGVILYKKEA